MNYHRWLAMKNFFGGSSDGAGSGTGDGTVVVKPITITENGTYTPEEGVDGFSEVKVEVQATGGSDKLAKMVDGTITEMTAADLGNITKIAPHAFAEQDALASVEIPETVTEIGANAFFGCGALKGITIPKNVTKFGNYVFASSNLESITFENVGGISSFGTTSFKDCTKLKEVHIDDLSAWCGKSFSSTYWMNPLYGGAGLYVGNDIINDLIIPDDVTTIAEYAFNGCGSLKSVTMHDGVTNVKAGAFSTCANIESVKLSAGLTMISGQLFYKCTNLKTIDIPSSVTEIQGSVFYYAGLTSITIPDSVTIVGSNVCQGCTDLTSATIGAGATTIGQQMFDGCTNLMSVTIGAAIKTIYKMAFRSCPLESLTVKATTPPTLASDALANVPTDCAIYVPAESVDAYKAATNWSARADYIFAIEEDA